MRHLPGDVTESGRRKAERTTPVHGDDHLIPTRRHRRDIQGLRGLAVALVVVFHLYPTVFSGGFVGVDVFFVISGYLITAHLWHEVERTGTIRLRDFWARRIRRLLPVAYLVLAVTLLVVLFVVPRTQWFESFRQIAASALYLENWHLAHSAVDYMAQDSSATVVQHYWSLSVEEQFYIVWPVMLVVALLLVRRMSRTFRLSSAKVVTGVLLLVVICSLWHSVAFTAVSMQQAYFFSTTRAWEFAVGGLIAMLHQRRLHSWVRWWIDRRIAGLVVSCLGVLAILASAILMNGTTEFPGWRALVPVVGAAVILAAPDLHGKSAPLRLLSSAPLVKLGDISYSVYLWHWPIIIVVPLVTGREISVVTALVAVALTVLLAVASTRWVEDRLRFGTALRGTRRPIVFAALAAVVVASSALIAANSHSVPPPRVSLEELARGGQDECVGPDALRPDNACAAMGDGPYISEPSAVAAQNDQPKYPGCQQDGDREGIVSCELGVGEDPRRTIALFGDSHATAWFSGFDVAGQRLGWRMRTFTRSSCPPSTALRVLSEEQTATEQRLCQQWVEAVLDEIAGDTAIDGVMLTSFASRYAWASATPTTANGQLSTAATETVAIQGYQSVMERIRAMGKEVYVLAPIPRTVNVRVPDCLELYGRDANRCGLERDRALIEDPMRMAARAAGSSVKLIDLTDHFCDAERCYPVVGDLIVYRDSSHLTAEYAAALMPWVARVVDGDG